MARTAAADTKRAATDKLELGRLLGSMGHYSEALAIYEPYLAVKEEADPDNADVATVCWLIWRWSTRRASEMRARMH